MFIGNSEKCCKESGDYILKKFSLPITFHVLLRDPIMSPIRIKWEVILYAKLIINVIASALILQM